MLSKAGCMLGTKSVSDYPAPSGPLAPGKLKVALFSNNVSWGAFAAVFSGLSWALSLNGVASIDVLYYNGHVDRMTHEFPAGVNFIQLKGGRGLRIMGELRRYLDRANPDFLISGPTHVNLNAIVVFLASRWRRRGGRLIITHHSMIESSHQDSWKDNKWLVRLLYPFASASFGVSPGIVEDAIRHAHLDPRTTTCIPNVIVPREPNMAEKTHPWLDEKSGFVFISVSRLVKSKKVDLLITAFRSVRNKMDCRLVIAGDGPERENLAKLIGSMSMSDCVALCGFVQNPRLFMQKADAFVLASNVEGFGLVAVEAMSAGCPVICTNAMGGGIEYILNNGEYGMLIVRDNEAELAQAMERMTDESIRQKYRDKALRRVQDFCPEQVGGKLLHFLSGLND